MAARGVMLICLSAICYALRYARLCRPSPFASIVFRDSGNALLRDNDGVIKARQARGVPLRAELIIRALLSAIVCARRR